MEELLNEYGVGKDIAKGDILEGSVIGTTESEVTVNIGYRSDGIVSAEDLPEKSTAGYSEGDAIKVYVVSLDNGEGLVKLSAIKALENVIWDEFQSLKDAKSVVTVKVTEVVKGGLATLYKGYRVFVPASQIGLSFTEDLSSYVGKELEVIITDVTKEKRNVVASNRLVEKDKKQAEKLKALESLQVGDRLTGKVARLESYGAFVEIGGVDGLVHISQMSFRRIKHPSEVVTAGENVVVEIISIDKEKEKVSLKLTELKGNPWENVDEKVKKGDKLTAKVLRIAPFGAFVEIEEGLEGLVHISKLSENRVENVSDVVKPGDEVTVTVISVDKDAQKISLSMREEVEKPRPEKKDRPKKSESKEERSVFSEENAAKPTTLEDLFKDKLSKFL